jgi:hypothetical protein
MNDLLLYWFLFVSSSAFVGALLGTLAALGVRRLYIKVKEWTNNVV